MYVRSKSKKTRTSSSSILAAGHSFDGLAIARNKGAYNSTNHFIELLKDFPNVLRRPSIEQHGISIFPRDRAFADSIWVELLFIP